MKFKQTLTQRYPFKVLYHWAPEAGTYWQYRREVAIRRHEEKYTPFKVMRRSFIMHCSEVDCKEVGCGCSLSFNKRNKIMRQEIEWHYADKNPPPIGEKILALLPKQNIGSGPKEELIPMRVTARRGEDNELVDHEGEETGWYYDHIMWWAELPDFTEKPGWVYADA